MTIGIIYLTQLDCITCKKKLSLYLFLKNLLEVVGPFSANIIFLIDVSDHDINIIYNTRFQF